MYYAWCLFTHEHKAWNMLGQIYRLFFKPWTHTQLPSIDPGPAVRVIGGGWGGAQKNARYNHAMPNGRMMAQICQARGAWGHHHQHHHHHHHRLHSKATSSLIHSLLSSLYCLASGGSVQDTFSSSLLLSPSQNKHQNVSRFIVLGYVIYIYIFGTRFDLC